jgi:hypothetical protein
VQQAALWAPRAALSRVKSDRLLVLAVVVLGGLGSGCSTVDPTTTSASTTTAIGVINDQVDKGNMEIEGDSDTAPLP